MKSIIIDRLIQIEEDAKDMSKNVEEKSAKFPALMQQKCNEIEAKLKSEYEEKVEQIKSDKENEAEFAVSEIETAAADRLKKLSEYFNENHETWENDILNAILRHG